MTKLSNHFNRGEFACKCGCGFDTVDIELIKVLEHVRHHFDRPVTINSAARCKDRNRAEGGSDKSQHLIGRAADIVVDMVPSDIVHEFLDETYGSDYGLGRYDTFTHVDTRGSRARW